MMASCQAPIPDGTLLDYWAHDLADGVETDQVEETCSRAATARRVCTAWRRSGPDWRRSCERVASWGPCPVHYSTACSVRASIYACTRSRLARQCRVRSFPATIPSSPSCEPISPPWRP